MPGLQECLAHASSIWSGLQAFSMTGRNRGSTVFWKLLSPILEEKNMQISTSFLPRI